MYAESMTYNPFVLDCRPRPKVNVTNSETVKKELIKFIEKTFTKLSSLGIIDKVNELMNCWKHIFLNTRFRNQLKNDEDASILLYKLTTSVVFQYGYTGLPTEKRDQLIKCIKDFIAGQRWRCTRITNLPTILDRQHQWEIKVLCKITNGEYEWPMEDEIIQFFKEEKEGILMRITILQSPHTEMKKRIANLARSFLRAISNDESIDFDIRQTDIDYCWDTYFCALYHCQRNWIMREIEYFPLDEAFHVMKRLQDEEGKPVLDLGTFQYVRKDNSKKFWKDFQEVVAFVNNKILLHTVTLPKIKTSESGLMEQMIKKWFVNEINGEKDTMKNILLMVKESTCAYNCLTFWDYVMKNYYGKPDMMEFLIEITTRCMNDIETDKRKGNYSEVKVSKVELCSIFDTFSKLFKDHKNIVREFALTKFFLSPTKDTLNELENMAARTSIGTPSSGEIMEDVVPATHNIQDELSAFTREVRESLLLIASYQRPNFLSSDLDWPVLRENCVKYLQEFEKTENEREALKLNYLNIDFAQLEFRPRNDDRQVYEKGYEQYAPEEEQCNDVPSATRENNDYLDLFPEDDDDTEMDDSNDSDYDVNPKKKAKQKGKKSRRTTSRSKRGMISQYKKKQQDEKKQQQRKGSNVVPKTKPIKKVN